MSRDDCADSVVAQKVFKWWDYLVFAILSCASWGAILNFIYSLVVLRYRLDHPVAFFILAFMLLVILANNQGKWIILPYMKRPLPMAPRAGWKVGVATSFVPGAEPIEMLERTLSALVSMDYPHDTWVLDEGDSPEVKGLCRKLGAFHFSRNGVPQYQAETGKFQSRSKHGNYNAWLHEAGFSRYDIISMFDPDHVPQRDFLTRILGCFNDPGVACVQAAQAYYNQEASFIARGAAEETYSYYSSVQMAGYANGYPIVIGCHNTHRSAALRQIGGLATHVGEDLLITMLYRASGWRGVYIPEIIARGLTPVDWDGYLAQQRGWARVVLNLKLRVFPALSKRLPLRARVLSLLHGLGYLHRSFLFLIGITGFGFMLISGEALRPLVWGSAVPFGMMLVSLQICEFYRQRFYLDWRNEWGLHWRSALLQYAKWPYFLLAFYEVMLGKPVPYVLTRKVKGSSCRYLCRPHLLVIVFIVCCWTIGVASGRHLDPFLHACAVCITGITAGIVLSNRLNFPAPYDNELADTRLPNQALASEN